ncbi:MAG: 2-hydroxyacid dehydrogenase [Reyranellaceae bacterium]
MSVLFISRDPMPEKLIALFRQKLPGLDFRVWPEVGKVEEIEYALAWRPPDGELAKLPKLKAILSFAAGIDHLAGDPELPRNVPVLRAVSDASKLTMSSYCAAQVLRFHHRLDLYAEFQKQGVWKQVLPRDMSETAVGILGLGVLGLDLAQRLLALGFPVNGWAKSGNPVDGVRMFHGKQGFVDCLAASAVVVCLLPLTEETRGILDASAFAAMPRDSYIVNVARGGHVVVPDLIAAIDSGHLAGATLDVFEPEPLPADSPLWRHPKITVTPHTAGRMSSARVALNMVEMLRQATSGAPLQNVVDWNKGY